MGTSDPRTYAIIGAAMQVHRTLGCGFLEAVYHDSLALELTARGIPFREQAPLPVHYRGERVGSGYKVDFQCFGDLIVEVKAQSALDSTAIAQTVNYMRAAGQSVGLLLNFGAASLEYRRLLVTPKTMGAANSGGSLSFPPEEVQQAWSPERFPRKSLPSLFTEAIRQPTGPQPI